MRPHNTYPDRSNSCWFNVLEITNISKKLTSLLASLVKFVLDFPPKFPKFRKHFTCFVQILKVPFYPNFIPNVLSSKWCFSYKCRSKTNLQISMQSAGDPGFLVGGGANPPQEGASTYKFARFSQENYMKLRTFWSGGLHWIRHWQWMLDGS